MVGQSGRALKNADALGPTEVMEQLWLTDSQAPLGARSSTRQELRLAGITWIERTYRQRRRQARLGRLTSIEYENINLTQVAVAA